jgi:hypothetical protein
MNEEIITIKINPDTLEYIVDMTNVKLSDMKDVLEVLIKRINNGTMTNERDESTEPSFN